MDKLDMEALASDYKGMDELDKEALDPKWFKEYYENFDIQPLTAKQIMQIHLNHAH